MLSSERKTNGRQGSIPSLESIRQVAAYDQPLSHLFLDAPKGAVTENLSFGVLHEFQRVVAFLRADGLLFWHGPILLLLLLPPPPMLLPPLRHYPCSPALSCSPSWCRHSCRRTRSHCCCRCRNAPRSRPTRHPLPSNVWKRWLPERWPSEAEMR